MKQTVGRVMISGGNAYTLPYADVLVNAPSTSGYNLTDKNSFLQMVIHVYRLRGDPLNFSHDRRAGLLKAVETGAYPYFTLICGKFSSQGHQLRPAAVGELQDMADGDR